MGAGASIYDEGDLANVDPLATNINTSTVNTKPSSPSSSDQPLTPNKQQPNKNPNSQTTNLYVLIKNEFAQVASHRQLNPDLFKDLTPAELDAKDAEVIAKKLDVSEALIYALRRGVSVGGGASPSPTEGPFDHSGIYDRGINQFAPIIPSATLPELPESTATSNKSLHILETLSKSRQHDYLVGIDGSDNSMLAFNTMLMLRKPQSKVSIVYVDDDSKHKYLPVSKQWGGVSEDMENRLIPIVTKEMYSVVRIWKEQESTVKRAFVDFSNESVQPFFVVVGWVGRKGPKENPSVLGSVTDLAIRSCHHPLIIVKSLPPGSLTTPAPYTYVVCVDGFTERGRYCFETTLALCKEKDFVTLLNCCDAGEEESGDAVKKHYAKLFNDYGLEKRVSFVTVVRQKGTGESIAHPLSNYINESQPTFVVVAPDVELDPSRVDILSVSERLLKECKSNFIVLKVGRNVRGEKIKAKATIEEGVEVV